MIQKNCLNTSLFIIFVSACCVSWLVDSAIAQIMPDASLGEGRSRLTRNVEIRGERSDRIDGGITRSTSLFHSFEAFNISADQRVYFANPSGIQSIFSRVTGNDVSDILGTLGVDGNADLFLMNPNGIIFGNNAQLDIRGSFLATTADTFVFEDGSQFSSVNPELPSLLTLNVTPGLQYGRNPGEIANTASLSSGRNLTLAAGSISNAGSLTAEFGHLNLNAVSDNVVITDGSQLQSDKELTISAANQVQITNARLLAGEELQVQGGRAIALTHSELLTGRDMTFRAPVRQLGNSTTFTTGGYFVTEAAEGTVVDFLIPHEHVILARGDVRLNRNYQGPSLYILAGGRITVAEDVTDISIDSTGENQIIRDISDGMGGTQQVTIQAGSQPVFDGRSGIDWSDFPGLEVANTNMSTALVSFGNDSNPNHITNASLNLARIGTTNSVNITNAGGQVYLSNRYRSNPILPGNILINSIDTSGFLDAISITIESRGSIIISGTINASLLPRDALSLLLGTNPNLDAVRELFSTVNMDILPRAGDIELVANQAVVFKAGSTIEAVGLQSGDINVIARHGNLNLDDTIIVLVNIDTGEDGNIPLEAHAPYRSPGDIFLAGDSILINSFSKVINIALFGQYPAGDLTVFAIDRIRITNEDGTSITELSSFPSTLLTQQFDAFSESTGLASTALAEADAGQLVVTSSQLFIRNNQSKTGGPEEPGPEQSTGILSASLRGSSGDAGDVFINNRDTVLIRGNQPGFLVTPNSSERAQLFQQVRTGINLTARGTGLPGNLDLQARQLNMSDGATIISGVVGNLEEQRQIESDRQLSINVSERISLDGKAIIATSTLSTGSSGNLRIDISESGDGLFLSNGAVISADSLLLQQDADIDTSLMAGSAGNIVIDVPSITLTNNARIGAASVDNGGPTGSIAITTNYLTVGNSLISTSSENDTQTAGNLVIEAERLIQLRGDLEQDNRQGGILAEATTDDGNAGRIHVTTPQLIIEDGAAILTSANAGDAGSIQLQGIDDLLMRNGEISAQSNNGQAGNINLQANRVSLEDSTISTATGENTSGAEIRMQGLDLLFMTEASLISAQAGVDANGGQVFIDAANGFVIATAGDNNDIIARANEGRGGNINITALDIFGLEERDRLTPFSDISASSDFGTDGTISIESLEVNPLNGALELPSTLIDVAQLVEQQLCTTLQGSSFVATGQGGVPSAPNEPFLSEDVWEDWRLFTVPESEPSRDSAISELNLGENSLSTQTLSDDETMAQHYSSQSIGQGNISAPIAEAQGWQRIEGDIVLVSHFPNYPSDRLGTNVTLPSETLLQQCQSTIVSPGDQTR
ncbi:MAG: filamentous hemagglutinin N-terminal domain-containing protein [Leptolyngbyaceae cyanobacterium]